MQVRAEADTLRRDLTAQQSRLKELTAQLEQERGQSEWRQRSDCACIEPAALACSPSPPTHPSSIAPPPSTPTQTLPCARRF